MAKQQNSFGLSDTYTLPAKTNDPSILLIEESVRTWTRNNELTKRIFDGDVSILSTNHMTDELFEIVEGHDSVYTRLKSLQTNEVALIRFAYGTRTSREQMDFRFRRFELDAGLCKVTNRDKMNYRMFDTSKEWYESCFSRWRESLESNIGYMVAHDSYKTHPFRFEAECMIIIPKGCASTFIEDKAWYYLQDGIYIEEKLELESCRIYKALKNA